MKQALLNVLVLAAGWGANSNGHAQAISKQPTYDQCKLYQISWYQLAEHPVSVSTVLKRRTYSETILHGGRLQQVARRLPGHRPSTSGKVSDIRLVGLFYAGGHADTLLIDAMERCSFRGKQFKLTKRLATLLDARIMGLNPRETERIRAIQIAPSPTPSQLAAAARPGRSEYIIEKLGLDK